MKRLTNDREISTVACCRNVCGNNCAPAMAWDRLKAIEDILGDSYELEELKQRWGYMGLIGKTVYGIRRRYTTKTRKGVMKDYDRAVGSPWILERYPGECYVAERVCVRSDLAKLGSTVFLTREEAEEKIDRIPVSPGGNFRFNERYYYKADGDLRPETWRGKWRPSIHMPKEAARLFLRVKSVRVERLQDIDDAGVAAEGLEVGCFFDELWDSTIKKSDRPTYGYDANPWVWVIEFERCEKPEATP